MGDLDELLMRVVDVFIRTLHMHLDRVEVVALVPRLHTGRQLRPSNEALASATWHPYPSQAHAIHARKYGNRRHAR
jgi:hypothetical protein